MANRISSEIKERVIAKIKSAGLSVSQAAEEFGLSRNTIYGWVAPRTGSRADPGIMEMSRLKRENNELKQIIGLLTLESERGKKNRWSQKSYVGKQPVE